MIEYATTQETNYPVTYNHNYYVCMANDIIKGKQDMTLSEARLIRLLIMQIAQEDKDLKTYTIKIQDLAKFLKISDKDLYRDIRNICTNLLKRVIYIGTNNPKDPWEAFQWVQKAKYDGNGNVTLMLSEQLKPYVIELSKWFTRYQYKDILAMSSYYAIRLYELLRAVNGEQYFHHQDITFKIDYLREYFGCEKKYKVFKDFKRNVIEIAVKEINKNTQLELSFQTVKSNRRVTDITFHIDSIEIQKIKGEGNGEGI